MASVLRIEIDELKNAIKHLERSNRELQTLLEFDPDPEYRQVGKRVPSHTVSEGAGGKLFVWRGTHSTATYGTRACVTVWAYPQPHKHELPVWIIVAPRCATPRRSPHACHTHARLTPYATSPAPPHCRLSARTL